MKFLVIHGSFGSSEGNWIPRLKEKLELLNQEVLVPQFPIDDWDEVTKRGRDTTTKKQNLDNWLNVFEKKVLPFLKNEKIVLVAHSLGPLFALHAISQFKIRVDAAIFVSPFLFIPKNDKFWQIDVANKSFYKQSFNFNQLKKQIPLSFVLYSEHDPYIPISRIKEFADKLGSSMIPILGGKHLSSEFNQNEFPLVLELCKSRIKLSLYQKYLAYISEYHPTDVVKKAKDRVLFLPSSELAKEGTFHFQNLSKNGFCTFLVQKMDYWTHKQGNYMKECRKAAQRVPITRVYIFENPKDIQNRQVRSVMEEDKKAGVKVYTCLQKDLEIAFEKLDFGIWDESYVCTVLYGKGDSMKFSLDSGERRLKEAASFKKLILSKAREFRG